MALANGRPARIAVLLGKPPRPASVVSDVLDLLRRSADVALHVPEGGAPLPQTLAGSSLAVQRGLGIPELTAALRLETAGVRCCNRIAATLAVWDRAGLIQTLSGAGVPVPATVQLSAWPEVAALAARQPLVLKATDGSVGRGQGVLIATAGSVPPAAPFPGPYLAQEYVAGGDRVHKVYVVGERLYGLVKRWPRPPDDRTGEPYAVEGPLETLSRLVGAALDLDIYGVDFLFGSRGPVAVDVNPFPSCEGIPRAAETIAAYLLDLADQTDRNAKSH